jgi:hypothetical protein
MPRPGEAPAPVFTGLPYGENALMNQMSEAIPEDDALFDDGYDELAGLEPADDQTAFLFSQTDRPDEPLTAGMPFGEGPNVSKFHPEREAAFIRRIARDVAASPAADKAVRAWAQRAERGF